MTIVKVKNKDGVEGAVGVEDWANPKTQILDLVDQSGNSKPQYKDDLEYIGVEEY